MGAVVSMGAVVKMTESREFESSPLIPAKARIQLLERTGSPFARGRAV